MSAKLSLWQVNKPKEKKRKMFQVEKTNAMGTACVISLRKARK